MIEGKKIRLRALTRKDFEKTFKWHNDLDLKNLVLSHPFPVTDIQEEEWFESILKNKTNRNVYFGIEILSNNELVGIIFLSNINMIHSTCWLGVLIGDEKTRGKGFGKEAVNLIVDYAFTVLNLKKVSLEVIATNKSAIDVYKKLEFIVEGKMKKQVFINGQHSDLIIMSFQNAS